MLEVISAVGKDLLQDVDLFDIYEQAAAKSNAKSLAFRLVYRSNEQTLTAETVNALHQQIVAALEKNDNWKVR